MNFRTEDMISMTYVCRICSSILKEAVQLICGHRYCQSCVNNRNEIMIIQCLICSEKTLKNEIRIDQDFQNQMNKFNVTCRLCNWTGIWKNYQNHSSNDGKKHQCILGNMVHQSEFNIYQTIKIRLEKLNEQVIEISKNFRIINDQIKQMNDHTLMQISR